MPIPLTCACGRSLRIRDALAGRKVKCPGCGSALAVPAAPEAGPPEVLPAAPPPRAVTNVPPRPRQEEPLDVLPADAPAGDDAIQAEPPPAGPRPRRRKRRRAPRWEEDRPRDVERRVPAIAFEEGWFGSTNAGVVGGLLMILIAVAWLVIGLAFGRLFIYPFILVGVGVIAIVKGLLEA
jgi:hypothetical protein